MDERTSEDLAEVLVQFEPVRQRAEHEEKYREAEQQQRRQDARCVPDIAGRVRDQLTLFEAGGCVPCIYYLLSRCVSNLGV